MKIIKIGAIWCPACLVMRKVWKKIENDYKLDILEYDYDIDNDKIGEYNVGKVLPVYIFLDKDGNELERTIGEVEYDKLKELIDKYGELLKNISEIMGSKVTGTPYTIIGNKVFSGYDYENSKGRFKGAIEYYSKYGYEDKVG